MGFKMSSSALKHKPWAEEHKEKVAHGNTPEAHNASPLKNANFRYQDVRQRDKKKTNTVGTGFMNPPYKDTVKGTRPYAKRQGYHGYKNFKSILKK